MAGRWRDQPWAKVDAPSGHFLRGNLPGRFKPAKSTIGLFFGWLNTRLKPYPETVKLKTRVHLRDGGIRPYIELEPIDHPLATEQRNGISVGRVAELYTQMVHDAAT